MKCEHLGRTNRRLVACDVRASWRVAPCQIQRLADHACLKALPNSPSRSSAGDVSGSKTDRSITWNDSSCVVRELESSGPKSSSVSPSNNRGSPREGAGSEPCGTGLCTDDIVNPKPSRRDLIATGLRPSRSAICLTVQWPFHSRCTTASFVRVHGLNAFGHCSRACSTWAGITSLAAFRCCFAHANGPAPPRAATQASRSGSLKCSQQATVRSGCPGLCGQSAAGRRQRAPFFVRRLQTGSLQALMWGTVVALANGRPQPGFRQADRRPARLSRAQKRQPVFSSTTTAN